MITWSQLAAMKFQPVQPRQISLYDYMWKLHFVLARRDSFPPGIWLDLHTFSLDFSLLACRLQNWRFIDFQWLKIFLLELFGFQLCVSILFHKIRSSRSQMFFKIGVLKIFAVFTGKHQRWSLFLIKLQTWRPVKRLQHRCFSVDIAKFLRTSFLQNTSGGCKIMKFCKDIC